MRRFIFGLCLIILIGASRVGFAEEIHHNNFISVKGGTFDPKEDAEEKGTNFMVGYDFISESGFGAGFELGYKNFKREMTVDVVGAKDITGEVEVHSIPFLFTGKYHLLFNEVVKPYLGAGVGFSFNHVDFDEIDKEVDKRGYIWLEKNENGVSFDVCGVAGIRFVIAQRFSLFVEGKYSYEMQKLEGIENDETLNFGGFYGNVGIGVEF
jgi:opacity protein-like surface antigen